MLTYRKGQPEDAKKIISLANEIFRGAGTDIDFSVSIPKAYGEAQAPASMDWHELCFQDGEPRGLVACLPCDLKVGDSVLRTGYIGTVGTHPSIRGMGAMKQLMAKQLDNARADGTDILMLGGQRQRYQHFGFVKAGVQYDFEISARAIRHALPHVNTAASELFQVTEESALPVWVRQLYESAPYRFERRDFVACAVTYVRRLFCVTENERPVGYFIVNAEGDTFEEIRAFSDGDLDLILKVWQAQCGHKSFTVHIPAWNTGAACHLFGWAENVSYTSCAMARILNWKKVLPVMLSLREKQGKPLRDGHLSLICEGEAFTIDVAGGHAAVSEGADENGIELDPVDMGDLLCNPFPPAHLPETPEGWFPLLFSMQTPDDF